MNELISRVFRDYAGTPRWVEWKEANGNKIPYITGTRRKASVTEPSTWRKLSDCRNARCGLVLNGDDLGGIDLDGCRDPKTGALTPWAAEIIADFDSYAEISPSGTGVKIFARGAPPTLINNVLTMPGEPINGKRPQVEAYVNNRYFTVTGNKLPEAPDEIRAAPEAWTRLEQYLNEKAASGRREAAGRNEALFRLGSQLHRKGKSDGEVAAAIRAGNREGNVELHENFAEGPLEEREVATIIRSALKQPPFPDVTEKGRPRPTLPNTKVALGQLGLKCRHDLFKLRYLVMDTRSRTSLATSPTQRCCDCGK